MHMRRNAATQNRYDKIARRIQRRRFRRSSVTTRQYSPLVITFETRRSEPTDRIVSLPIDSIQNMLKH